MDKAKAAQTDLDKALKNKEDFWNEKSRIKGHSDGIEIQNFSTGLRKSSIQLS